MVDHVTEDDLFAFLNRQDGPAVAADPNTDPDDAATDDEELTAAELEELGEEDDEESEEWAAGEESDEDDATAEPADRQVAPTRGKRSRVTPEVEALQGQIADLTTGIQALITERQAEKSQAQQKAEQDQVEAYLRDMQSHWSTLPAEDVLREQNALMAQLIQQQQANHRAERSNVERTHAITKLEAQHRDLTRFIADGGRYIEGQGFLANYTKPLHPDDAETLTMIAADGHQMQAFADKALTRRSAQTKTARQRLAEKRRAEAGGSEASLSPRGSTSGGSRRPASSATKYATEQEYLDAQFGV